MFNDKDGTQKGTSMFNKSKRRIDDINLHTYWKGDNSYDHLAALAADAGKSPRVTHPDSNYARTCHSSINHGCWLIIRICVEYLLSVVHLCVSLQVQVSMKFTYQLYWSVELVFKYAAGFVMRVRTPTPILDYWLCYSEFLCCSHNFCFPFLYSISCVRSVL